MFQETSLARYYIEAALFLILVILGLLLYTLR